MTVHVAAPPMVRSRHVLSVPVGDETVLYDPCRDAVHLLDAVASAVWNELREDTSVEELSRRLAELAREDFGRVRHDVRRLLTRLREAGVVSADGRALSLPHPRPDPAPVEDPPSWAASGPLPAMDCPYATTSFRALRHDFRVVTNAAEVRDWLDTVLVDLRRPATAHGCYTVLDLGEEHVGDRYVLGFDGETVARSGWLARILNLLLWHVNTEAAARSSGELVLLHAAAAARDGAAVVLPAPMEHGKTTTVAGLVRSGWQYLTDEMVAIDPASLRLVAYPRPMSVDRGSWEVLADLCPPHAERVTGQWQVPASSIRVGAVASGAQPVAVVSPQFRAGGETRIHRVSPGQLVLDLVDSAFAFREDPLRNLRTLADLACRVPGYRLTVGRLDHAVALIDLVGRA